jgi:hypothetical protein
MNIPFSWQAVQVFFSSLDIMWKGMLGIFIFMAIFYGLIQLLNRFFPVIEES